MTHLPGLLWPHVCRCVAYRWAHHQGVGRCHPSWRANPTMQWGSREAQRPFGWIPKCGQEVAEDDEDLVDLQSATV